jgi:hypothetical protein
MLMLMSLFFFLQANDKRLSPMCYGPAENSRVANYRMSITNFPLSLERKKWSKVETENLEKGIMQQFQAMVLQISRNRALKCTAITRCTSSGLGSHSYNLYMHFVHQFV